MKKLPLVFALALAACKPSPEPCTELELLELERAYVSEALTACRGQTYDGCAELPAIREKYKQKRAAWVRCEAP